MRSYELRDRHGIDGSPGNGFRKRFSKCESGDGSRSESIAGTCPFIWIFWIYRNKPAVGAVKRVCAIDAVSDDDCFGTKTCEISEQLFYFCFLAEDFLGFLYVAEKEIGSGINFFERLNAELDLICTGLECELYAWVRGKVRNNFFVKAERSFAQGTQIDPFRRFFKIWQGIWILFVFYENSSLGAVPENVMIIRFDVFVQTDVVDGYAFFRKRADAFFAVLIVADIRYKSGLKAEPGSADGHIGTVSRALYDFDELIGYLASECDTKLLGAMVNIVHDLRLLEADESVGHGVADSDDVESIAHGISIAQAGLWYNSFMKTLRECIQDAEDKKIAIGHFNFSNLEGFWAIVRAAKALEMPVILGLSEGERDFVGIPQAVALVQSIRKNGQPVFLNADHTYSFERVKEVVDAGFDSVIIDGAALPFEENVKVSARCVQYVRKTNPEMLIEGELGFIGQSSKIYDAVPTGVDTAGLTDPDQAKDFVDKTGIDLLAPAIGNFHGMLRSGDEPIQADVAEKVRLAAGVPIVLHGGSGISKEDFVKAATAGVSIIHINTELRAAYRKGLNISLEESPDEIAPYKYLRSPLQAMQKAVEEKIRIFSKLSI